jgi:hypothetical protein
MIVTEEEGKKYLTSEHGEGFFVVHEFGTKVITLAGDFQFEELVGILKTCSNARLAASNPGSRIMIACSGNVGASITPLGKEKTDESNQG